MRVTFYILLSTIFLGDCFSQTYNFQSLLELFEKGKDTEINDSLAKKYFDFTPNYDEASAGYRKLLVKEIVFKRDQVIGLSAYSDCGAGGICESSSLRIFDNKGNLIDELPRYESEFADCMDDSYRYCSFSSDSLLIIVNQKTEGDCMEDTIYTNRIDIEFYRIDIFGKIQQGRTQQIDTRRDHYSLSTDILNDEDLRKVSKNELSIMRNEIFAAHGYMFKSDKWIQYFKGKEWYKPLYDNVDDQFSLIEKLNIDLILKQEKK